MGAVMLERKVRARSFFEGQIQHAYVLASMLPSMHAITTELNQLCVFLLSSLAFVGSFQVDCVVAD